MKRLLATLVALSVAVGVSYAGPTAATSGKSFKQPVVAAPEPCIADNEFTIDGFGVYGWTDTSDYEDWGGGVAVNYFFMKYFGIGAEYFVVGEKPIHAVSGLFTLRFPVNCFAPYVFGVLGGIIDGTSSFGGGVGGGLEYRVTDKVGLFGDGRYVWAEEDEFNHALVRFGIRLAF